ncbi:hypothetical protein [Parvularcula sp. LCG005]|uniref:hypothetical protein n=1 Tax=Parvularcula sp. LCG005 TaxID=3078805 RepID=UPI002942A7CF|nr:hypothetical protein [Parvularcula sp. LCG005]WOI53893.1 hypothetical protein RUI03_02560 [Parvularcula sp. LCG005]
MMTKPFRQVASLAAGLALVCGCATSPRVTATYGPFNPASGSDVTFEFEATDREGLRRATLYVYEYEQYTNSSGMRAARRRPGGQWGALDSWSYPSGTLNATESSVYEGGFPNGTSILFRVEVEDESGRRRTEGWRFWAGDHPWGNSPILLLSGEARAAPASRIDVAFVPDSDSYTTARQMMPDVRDLVYDGYHINNVVRGQKAMWAFWYSKDRGTITDYDAPGPRRLTIPSSVRDSTIIDHAAVIHTTVKRDWASGGNFGTEPVNIGTAMHESGHAAFNLKDEYAGGAHTNSSDPHHNTYGSKADCEAYNIANGWPATDCRNIEDDWWAPEPASAQCIMLNDQDAFMPDFARTGIRRANWFYGQLPN